MSVEFDQDAAQAFLVDHYAGLPGLVQVCCTGDWIGQFFATTQAGLWAAAQYAAQLDRREPQGIYVRATTLRERPARRGGADDTGAVPYLWADVDYGLDGHKRDADKLPLPPTADAARLVIAESGMPEPTVLVHSGGGLYPLWRLDTPVDLATAADLSERVQLALKRASVARGWDYGTGVGDLARVLRLPGSVNRKTDTLRPCLVVGGTGALCVPAAVPARPSVERATATAGHQLPEQRPYDPGRGDGPLDALAARMSWADLLEPAGWQLVGTEPDGAERWLRPGDPTSSYSARAFEHNLVVHSESAGLPAGAGQRLTKGRLFAHLHYGGSASEAAKDLARAAHDRGAAPAASSLPRVVLDAVRAVTPTASRGFDELVDRTTLTPAAPAGGTKKEERSVPAMTDPHDGGTKKEETSRVPAPVVEPQVFHGLVGEICRTVDAGAHTEADPMGVLGTLLAGAGVLLGPSPHLRIASTRHPLLVWLLVFGSTGAGRKGESQNTAELFLRRIADYPGRRVTGLSSGEGLIEYIRDPVDEDDEGGTEDKRVLVIEPEFAGVMARAKREGSTLAAVLRQAWDGGALSVLNRKALHASSSHVALVGHITPREFRIRLAESEMSGGTYNRFLPVYVDRSKRLPLPEPLPDDVVDQLGRRLGAAIDRGSRLGAVQLGDAAKELWVEQLYDEFTDTDEDDQIWTEFTRRATPYCLRIAALHAVLDGRTVIDKDDLAAGGALVRYAIGSARFVLDRQVRDPRMDRIRRAIGGKPDGLTRTEVSGLFSRNLAKAALDLLLDELVVSGQYERVEVRTGGRPAVRYRPVVSSFFVAPAEDSA